MPPWLRPAALPKAEKSSRKPTFWSLKRKRKTGSFAKQGQNEQCHKVQWFPSVKSTLTWSLATSVFILYAGALMWYLEYLVIMWYIKAEIWKLWPKGFGWHRPIFAGNSRSTGISQLRAGKTRSKRPRSHWLSTVHLLPYMWASFYPLDPSRYLSSISSWRPKTKKIPFFTNLRVPLVKKFVGLLRTQFWCHWPSQ